MNEWLKDDLDELLHVATYDDGRKHYSNWTDPDPALAASLKLMLAAGIEDFRAKDRVYHIRTVLVLIDRANRGVQPEWKRERYDHPDGA